MANSVSSAPPLSALGVVCAQAHDLPHALDVRALGPDECQVLREVHALETLPWANGFYRAVGKPLLDRIIAPLLLVALAPILLVITIAIRVKLGKGVLFTQERVGRSGVPFPMLKFRTMRPDRRRHQVPFSTADRRTCHKRADDPRHTPLGRFLRHRSLDELPQLWNVMHGEMSLVGPRPELSSVVQTYEPWQHLRHLVKPGITGPWQVTARNDGTLLRDCTDLDVAYARTVSFRYDLELALATVRVVGNLGRGGT